MNSLIQLAIDLDSFEYDYDYYGYMDAIDDREQAIIELVQDLINRRFIDSIIERLTEIINEHDPDWSANAQQLLDRINAILQ